MSVDIFYFPKLSSLQEENLSLYFELIAYMESLPGGPWHFVEGYDPSHNGERYSFILSNLYHPSDRGSITAIKNVPAIDGHYFSFSSRFMPKE